MTIPLFFAGLLLSQTQNQVVPDVVKLLGKDVPIEFPMGGPLNAATKSVEAEGWKWEVKPDGNLGRRFLSDGGWGDLKQLYDKSKGDAQAKPFHIKVIIVQNATVVSKTPVGVVRQRWASIDDQELETVLKSLAVLKASIEASTQGKYNVRLDTFLDDDTYADWSSLESSANGATQFGSHHVTVDSLTCTPTTPDRQRDWFSNVIAPQLNDERFDTDDGTYNGPFAAAYVIHPGLPITDQIALIDHTPVATLSYYTFSEIESAKSLPTALYESWKRMVMVSAGRGGDYASRVRSDDDFAYPSIEFGPIWSALVEKSLRTTAEDASGGRVNVKNLGDLPKTRLSSQRIEGKAHKTIETAPDRPEKTLVSVSAADYLLAGSDYPITGVATCGNGDYLEVGVPEATLAAKLNVSGAGAQAKVANEPGTVVGDFDVATITAPAPGFEIKFKRIEPRGHVVIASGSPLLKAEKPGFVKFDLKLSADEIIYLDFVDSKGDVTGSALLGGDAPTPEEFLEARPLLNVSVPADDQWHSVTVPLDKLSQGREISQLRLRGGDDRVSRGTTSVSISAPSYVESGTASGATSTDNQAVELAKYVDPLTSDQKEKLLAALRATSITTRLTAMSVLARVKLPDSVLQLTTICRSGFAPLGAMAMRALAFQDTVDAWAVIREAVERGPFDHSRRFAAIELSKKPDPGMGASLNFMAARSWQARLEAVRALAAINTTSSHIIMAAMIQTEPHPSVRLQIVRSADLKIDLVSRRLIYAAINDGSQWVRAVALGRLIDSENSAIRAEALMGVKDEAVGVRLYVLDQMRARGNEAYRPALRIAVTDISPSVRAAALKAFATQPGPVDPNEVKNTWQDTDAEVRDALKALAQAKGFKVPQP